MSPPVRAPLPPSIDHDRHVSLTGRGGEPWTRRVLLALVTAFVVAALLGAFGQEDVTTVAATDAATLRVRGPDRVRGGLFFQVRIDVTARRAIAHPVLVFARGFNEQLQINTIEPAPVDESSQDGRMRLDYGRLQPGDALTVYMQFEVNPTNVGRRNQRLELRDGDGPLTAVDRTITVFP